MGTNITAYVLYGGIVLAIFAIITTVFSIFFVGNSSKMESLRNEQLKDQSKKKSEAEQDAQIRQIVVQITDPIVDKVYHGANPKNQKLLAKKLKLAEWDKYFTPIQWKAFVLLLRVIAVVLFIGLFSSSFIFASIVFSFFAIMPSFLLNNSYNNHKEEIMMSFPETIKIISGYLSAGKILADAVDETSKSCAPTWSTLLKRFRDKCETDGIMDALDWFKDEVDLVEAKEFFTTLRLTLELGGSAKSGFDEQADRIQAMLRDVMQRRIEKRKIWATVVQAPIFLCIIGAFALPVVGSFADIF